MEILVLVGGQPANVSPRIFKAAAVGRQHSRNRQFRRAQRIIG
jgi:hypothetical protein